MNMTSIALSFIKKNFSSVSSAQSASQVAGAIVFDKAHKVLCVDGDVYGGQVQDVTYVDNVLTITKSTGNPIVLNFSDIASASSVMEVFQQIKNLLGITDAVQSVQGHFTDTAYLQGAQSLIASDKILDQKVKGIQGVLEGLQDVAYTGNAEDVTVSEITYDGVSVQGPDGTIATNVQDAFFGMLQGVVDKEHVTEEAFEAVQNAVGLNENLNYVQQTNSHYIQGAQSVTQALGQLDLALQNAAAAGEVTVIKESTATQGYFATYTIKQNNQQVGVKIDIPKDFLVKSASVQEVTAADKAEGGKFSGEGYENWLVGDKYIDFVINTRDTSEQDEHIYILQKDLLKPYTVQQNATHVQLSIDENNVISAIIVDSSIGTEKLSDGAVQTAKIYDRAVTSIKIAVQGVTNENIGTQAVQNWNLAPEVVQVGTQEVIVNSDGTQGSAVSTIATVGGKEIKVAARLYWNEWSNDPATNG